MLPLVYFTMLIQQQKIYSIELKENVLHWEDTEGDRRDIFCGYCPAVSCTKRMVCGKENLRSYL